MVRKRLIITGEVSEGGIRYFAQMNAARLNISGFSKRGLEGAILIEAQGEEENIEKLKEQLKKGNGFFKVEEIKEEEIEMIPSEKNFTIK